MNRQISRKCDMGGGVKLRLLLEEDGDVLVSVMPKHARKSQKSRQSKV